MNNPVLDNLKKWVVTTLNNEYGFCGLADGDDMVMINSTDSEGNDIIINIEVKKEDE